ncbi:hypothetical protein [Methylobacterium trifolii]|nr:hypothetical protein [Methylobacterium trifolii]
MLTTLTGCIRAEFERLGDVGGPPWQSFFLRKSVYEAAPENRPVPDGLSRRYIETATGMNEAENARRAVERAREASGLLVSLELLLQAETARALLNEHDLLERTRTAG